MTYSEKLKDPRWQKKRLKILERDEFTCTCCFDPESTLVVHHLKYSGEPWEVEDKYLITLCESCHESWHEEKKLYKETLDDLLMYHHPDIYRNIANLINLMDKKCNFPLEVTLGMLEINSENFIDVISDCVENSFDRLAEKRKAKEEK